MLSLHNLTRHYAGAETPAVSGVSLKVPAGEILAIVGESGSGKTTLLRLIAGLETPDGGTLAIDGHLVADGEGKCWVPPEKREVGLVFQDGALFPHLTVAENAGYGIPKQSRESKAAIVDKMLALTGLDGFHQRYPHQLSGGERQRLAVARTLAPQPKLILLDEPFSNLDPALRRSLREEILTILQQAKITAIIVTHDTDDALAVGDRIAIFRDAGIEQTGRPAEIFSEPRNGYCARLFGPANRVCQNGGDPAWVRPERMSLALGPETDHAIRVRIRRSRHTGRHLELSVECLDPEISGGETWTVFVDDDSRRFPDGAEARVTIEGR